MNNKQLIVILGGGESGVGAALLAKKMGFKIFVSDSGCISHNNKTILLKNKISFEENKHTESIILNKSNKIIKSPGLSTNDRIIKKINHYGIPMMSEVEFGKNYNQDSYIISITGTNGKTTTSMMIYKILKQEGMQVGIAGNIGKSFAKEVLKKKKIYVLELSSFQLDDCSKFRSNIAVLLNITRDHLNIYSNIKNYIFSKFRIATLQKSKDIFIYNYDDPIIREEMKNFSIKSHCIPFSIQKELSLGAYIKNNSIFIRNPNYKESHILELRNIPLIGDHIIYNILASILASSFLNVTNQSITSTILGMKPIEHRMEPIMKINGVSFINDSKATNVSSVFYALKSLSYPIIWIAGGKDKGNDYLELLTLVKKKVKFVILLGKENSNFKTYFKNIIDIILETQNVRKAVRIAYFLSVSGDHIILSPACSSIDLFKNYIDRGRKFKKEVKKLFCYDENNKFFFSKTYKRR
ncbi:UDP-N-acetylmuramoyl-L-alanine--D-glutamate ligase [Blattabacterium cuenoti]|uniref:UDP-N-acetylmuramoyl-L-alanine--D-glutamate ligase n=1 Tax=Blattabacterium cuenoti TaxID=1653831 RepID=UPI00163CEE12|nr:UDP-N-acetylmuramoyl-L-alanine--D-glutamate ligase [Blattabacterium cuenoti]